MQSKEDEKDSGQLQQNFKEIKWKEMKLYDHIEINIKIERARKETCTMNNVMSDEMWEKE